MENANNKYLNNDQVEREEWELISITVRFVGNDYAKGYIHIVPAYKDEIDDEFMLRNGKYVFVKQYPSYIQRKLTDYIKEQLPTYKAKKHVIRITREKPISITIPKSITIIKAKVND